MLRPVSYFSSLSCRHILDKEQFSSIFTAIQLIFRATELDCCILFYSSAQTQAAPRPQSSLCTGRLQQRELEIPRCRPPCPWIHTVTHTLYKCIHSRLALYFKIYKLVGENVLTLFCTLTLFLPQVCKWSHIKISSKYSVIIFECQRG